MYHYKSISNLILMPSIIILSLLYWLEPFWHQFNAFNDATKVWICLSLKNFIFHNFQSIHCFKSRILPNLTPYIFNMVPVWAWERVEHTIDVCSDDINHDYFGYMGQNIAFLSAKLARNLYSLFLCEFFSLKSFYIALCLCLNCQKH